MSGLRPNRAESGLAALAAQANLVRRLGSYVAQAQIEDLLNASARIEHQCEQGIIAFT